MARQVPGSVTGVYRVLWALVVWGGITALLTYVLRDRVVLSWAEGNKTAQEILDDGGLAALRASPINIPNFVPLAIVLFVVFAALAGVLGMFFRGRHGWARIGLTVLAAGIAFGTLAMLGRGVPGVFVFCSIVAVLLCLALIVLLWHRDTGAYLKGTYGRV